MSFPGRDYYTKLTSIGTYIDSALSDWPAFLNGSMVDATFWANVQANGGDIVITSDLAGNNRVPLRVVKIDTLEEELFVWFKMDSISASGGDEYYLWFKGGGSETQPARDTADIGSENVWDSNFIYVSHTDLERGVGLEDETLNENDFIENSTGLTYGVAGPNGFLGVNFPNTQANFLRRAYLMNAGVAEEKFTVESWWNANNFNKARSILSVENKDDFMYVKDTSDELAMNLNGNLKSSSVVMSPDTDYYTVATHYEGTSKDLEMFINGSSVYTSTQAASDTTNDWWIGKHRNDDPFNGEIAEMRISDIIRADAWIKANYYNQKLVSNVFSASGSLPAPSNGYASQQEFGQQSSQEYLNN